MGAASAPVSETDRRAWIEPQSLVTALEAPNLFDRYPTYRDGLTWLEQFVTQPHADLGRAGAVCPRLAPALRADTVWLVAVATTGDSPDHAADAGRRLTALFAELADGPRRRSSALLAFFPYLHPAQAGDFIDGGHRLLRPMVVEQGLMIGEFHPTSTVASVHNPAFPVMRCPVPMFAVRALTVHDLMFLDQPQTPPADRLVLLRHYDRHVGPHLSATAHAELEARIADTRHALNRGDLP